MRRLQVRSAAEEAGMVRPPWEDAQPQGAKGHAVQLAATTRALVWATEEMEECGEKGPQGCGSE